MRILVVEDDDKIASFICKGFREEGFAIDRAADGEEGLYLAINGTYDAAIVDIMLPKLDGLSLIEQMRGSGNTTPVLILSARASVDDRVNGLRRGGDDYLTKPFSYSELVARLEALVRRAGVVGEPTLLSVDDLEVDVVGHRVTRNGQRIDLQPREFSLLEYLVRNKGRVVSKTMIMEHVWGYDFDPQTNVVESRLSRLRDKIDVDRESSLIRTVRGAGYVIEEVQ